MGSSSIEWTDSTWQVTAGCARVSEGCRNCYAERMSGRLAAMAVADQMKGRDPGKKAIYLQVVNNRPGEGLGGYGPKSGWNHKVVSTPQNLHEPFHWLRPRRIFVNSQSDLFHSDVSFEYIAAVYGVMDACECTWRKPAEEPHGHVFQVLTKRPERAAEFYKWVDEQSAAVNPNGPRWTQQASFCNRLAASILPMDYAAKLSLAKGHWPPVNVMLGTSCENQQTADERIPHLMRCPAAVRFLSCEPLLSAIDLELDEIAIALETGPNENILGPLHWVIVGGESGPGARPMHPDWARSIRDQCQAAGVPFFFKQGSQSNWVDFKDFDSFPEDLRIRQFPEVANVQR